MSGGGGGGGDGSAYGRTTTGTKAGASGNPPTTPMQTIQPGMPGQISTLADQLAAGFGQNPADIMAQLQQYYQPMSIPNYAPVTPATTPTTPKPVTTPHSGNNGGSITGRGVVPGYDAKTGAYNPPRAGGANR